MKKILITVCLLLSMWQANSQEVYKNIFKGAEKVLNDPNSNQFIVDVCNFEVMALKYLKTQAFKQGDEVQTEFLDTQAEYMTKYINSFFSNLAQLREQPKEQKKMIYNYMKTSLRNPLFNDSDEETTECFVNDSTSYTRFSLNTNWEKAYHEMEH